MAVSQGGFFVIQFASSVVLARLLSPYEMGVFAAALAITGLLAIIRSIGLPAYLVRSKEMTEELATSVFTVNALVGVIMAAAIAGLSVVGGHWMGDPAIRTVLLGLSILPLMGILDFLPAALLERDGNFRVVAMVTIAKTLVGSGSTVFLAFEGYSTMSLVYGQLLAAAVSVLGFNLLGWRHARFRLGLSEGRPIARYALQIVGISGVTILVSRLSELVLGRLQGLDALGLYSRATGLSITVDDCVHMVIARVVFVEFANQRRAGLALRTVYLRAVQMMTALLWPAFAGLAVLARPVVLLLYGETWLPAAAPLSLLCLAAAILVAITMTWEVFNVCEQTGRHAQIEFMRAGLGLVLFSGGSLLGLTAAAGARVLEAVFSILLYRRDLDRLTGTGWSDLLPIYGQSAALTLCATLPALGAMTAFGWAAAIPAWAFAGAILAGMAAWLAALAATRHPLFAEILRLLPFASARG